MYYGIDGLTEIVEEMIDNESSQMSDTESLVYNFIQNPYISRLVRRGDGVEISKSPVQGTNVEMIFRSLNSDGKTKIKKRDIEYAVIGLFDFDHSYERQSANPSGNKELQFYLGACKFTSDKAEQKLSTALRSAFM